jgi:hypothetical protein
MAPAILFKLMRSDPCSGTSLTEALFDAIANRAYTGAPRVS